MDVPLPTSGFLTGAFLVSSVLYGINLLLYGQYRLSAKCMKDRYVVKITVTVVLALLTIQIAFLTYGMYQNYAQPNLISQIMSPIAFVRRATVWDNFTLTHNDDSDAYHNPDRFFASRVWILSKERRLLFALILVFSLVQLGAGFAQFNGILHLISPGLDLWRASMTISAIQTVSVTVADVLITWALCYTFNQSRSGIIQTDTVLDKLITYAIHRAAATRFVVVKLRNFSPPNTLHSFAALLTLVLFASVTRIPVFMVPFVASGQLYGISMISMLLNRSPLQSMLQEESSCSIPNAPQPLERRGRDSLRDVASW
ncbi:hypothetical protein ONZ45_g4431 [Pleurotus djamor]|nr:hypothetical protein ONZ45_g4431 [Pleurotus djamor]